MRLESINGIGKKSAQTLRENGFRRVEHCAYGSLRALRDVEGVNGPRVILGAQKLLGLDDEKPMLDINDATWHCKYGCGFEAEVYGTVSMHERQECPRNPDKPGRYK